MSISVVIFDLDGTITQPYFDFDAIRKEMGLARDSGPVLEAMEKMDVEERKRVEAILHYHEEKAVFESSLNPGAKETLSALQGSGIRIGILTRNRRGNALAVAQKHGLEFDVVVGREEGPAKPDTFGVLEICRQFGARPEETLLVGDYLFDLLCAKSAGALSVLLANQEKADEFAEHADFTIDKIEQVLEIIDKENGGQAF
jgi:HAD superfamily hydrolase (TIGR01549 family)